MAITFKHGFQLYAVRLRTDANGPVYLKRSEDGYGRIAGRIASGTTRDMHVALLVPFYMRAEKELAGCAPEWKDFTADVVEVECTYTRVSMGTPNAD